MTKMTFLPFDPADYLKCEESIAGYLEASAEEAGADPSVMAHAHEVVARARRRLENGGADVENAEHPSRHTSS